MAQEGNILLDPFFQAFPELGDKLNNIHLNTRKRNQKFWIRRDNDILHVWSRATNLGSIPIQLRQHEGKPCLYTVCQPEQDGKIVGDKVEVYAESWLELADKLKALESRFFQEPFLNLMRQLGGDPDPTCRYELVQGGTNE